MANRSFVVEGYRVADGAELDLREDAFSYALDQRAFGPRRLLVVFADALGKQTGIAHCRRPHPPERALDACVRKAGQGAALAIAYCDEPVREGPPPPDTAARFAWACEIMREHGIHLVDWFACDGDAFRSVRLALHPDEEWWNVP